MKFGEAVANGWLFSALNRAIVDQASCGELFVVLDGYSHPLGGGLILDWFLRKCLATGSTRGHAIR